MADATTNLDAGAHERDVNAPHDLDSGRILQLPDGRAGVTAGLIGIRAGERAAMITAGEFNATKAVGIAAVDGDQVYWDRSARHATTVQSADTFFLGLVVGDVANADETMVVDLNRRSIAAVDLLSGDGDTVIVAATGDPTVTFAAGTVTLALDGTSLDVKLQSTDGTTTVAATDTTVDAVVGTPIHFLFDLRDRADVKIYLDGVRVLPDTLFSLAEAGDLQLLAHVEKTASNTPGSLRISDFFARTTDVLES